MAADAYLDRVRPLNRLYNLIMRIRTPKRANQVSDLGAWEGVRGRRAERGSQGLVSRSRSRPIPGPRRSAGAAPAPPLSSDEVANARTMRVRTEPCPHH